MRRVALVVGLVLLLAACGRQAKDQLLDANGDWKNPTLTSDAFVPTSRWSLEYDWDCRSALGRAISINPKQPIRMDLYNSDDDTYAAEHPHLTGQGMSGKTTVAYKHLGSFYLKVASSCDWHLQAVQSA